MNHTDPHQTSLATHGTRSVHPPSPVPSIPISQTTLAAPATLDDPELMWPSVHLLSETHVVLQSSSSSGSCRSIVGCRRAFPAATIVLSLLPLDYFDKSKPLSAAASRVFRSIEMPLLVLTQHQSSPVRGNFTAPQQSGTQVEAAVGSGIARPVDANVIQTIPQKYRLAYKESLGFFDDLEEWVWKRAKKRCRDQMIRDAAARRDPALADLATNSGYNYAVSKPGKDFYLQFYSPGFTCPEEERIGRLGDGGKWMCDPYRVWSRQFVNLSTKPTVPPVLVYSIGSNNDWGFEDSVLADGRCPYCEIHTFDHTINANTQKPDVVNFHKIGLAAKDEAGKNLKTLPTLIKELGHENRRIEIFKIDCEGCEWSVFLGMFDSAENKGWLTQTVSV